MIQIRSLVLFALSALSIHATEPRTLTIDFQGQGSLNYSQSLDQSFSDSPMTLRYIPQLRADYQANPTVRLGLDAALDIYNYSFGDSTLNTSSEFYRLTLRYDSPRTQIRVGLQKINFGPARMLRMLQWFDQVDPRDPLALSPGVWAAMGRYYFNNGSNIRLWGMRDAPHAWRDLSAPPHDEDDYDFGGRVEYPINSGTLGFTSHIVQLDRKSQIYEYRYALDARADLIIGLWTEIVQVHRPSFLPAYRSQLSYMVGTDYTFGIGNGLYVSFEMSATQMGSFDTSMPRISYAQAISANYTLGLSDGLMGYVYLLGTPNTDTQFIPLLGWQHTQGNWLMYIALYDMPKLATGGTMILPTGTGLQLNIAYNH